MSKEHITIFAALNSRSINKFINKLFVLLVINMCLSSLLKREKYYRGNDWETNNKH